MSEKEDIVKTLREKLEHILQNMNLGKMLEAQRDYQDFKTQIEGNKDIDEV